MTERDLNEESLELPATDHDSGELSKWTPPLRMNDRSPLTGSIAPERPAADGADELTREGSNDQSSLLEVAVEGVPIYRVPASLTTPLRYVLAGAELPFRLGVTSSVSGEGATTISRSLAALIAHDWRATTCWIDLNWWKTETNTREQALFPFTIADATSGLAAVTNLPVQTSVTGLAMVAAGEVRPSARSQLPRNETLWHVVDELASMFDYVVLDLPPVLETADALALSRLGDAYLLVVRQKSVSSDQVRASLRTMSSVPLFGTTLNAARSKVPRWLRAPTEVWAPDERT